MNKYDKNQKTCGTCYHFRQHYLNYEGSYIKVSCGHCIYPRIKNRKELSPACEYYYKLEFQVF